MFLPSSSIHVTSTANWSQPKSLIVVGGGFSAAALCVYLLRHGPKNLTIHVVEPRPRLGQGIAYGDAAADHILNVPADKMSLWSDAPMAFVDWAREFGPALGWPQCALAEGGEYLPRQLYGYYVEAQLRRGIDIGLPSFHHHRAKAQTLERRGDASVVRLDDGQIIQADAMVLATGFRAPDLPCVVQGQGPRIIADPWTSGALDAIDVNGKVLIVGTGLTMVDAVYTLSRQGFKGHITALSRHGYLPRTHGRSEAAPAAIDDRDTGRGLRFALRKFRRAVQDDSKNWRSAVDALKPVLDELWQSITPIEQDRFLRHLRPLWEVHRHRMPEQSAQLLTQFMSLGQLTVKAGRLENLSVDAQGVDACWIERGSALRELSSFDWVINCTPPARLHAPGMDAWTQALEQLDLVCCHRSGLGLETDRLGRSLNRERRPVAGVYVLGPLRRGLALEVTAVPHIRVQLEDLTHELLGYLDATTALHV